MMLTALIMAGAVMASSPQQATQRSEPEAAAPASAPATSSGRAARRGPVCENRPVTGSRLNQRICRSSARAARDQENAQDFSANAQTVLASSEEMILNGGPR